MLYHVSGVNLSDLHLFTEKYVCLFTDKYLHISTGKYLHLLMVKYYVYLQRSYLRLFNEKYLRLFTLSIIDPEIILFVRIRLSGSPLTAIEMSTLPMLTPVYL